MSLIHNCLVRPVVHVARTLRPRPRPPVRTIHRATVAGSAAKVAAPRVMRTLLACAAAGPITLGMMGADPGTRGRTPAPAPSGPGDMGFVNAGPGSGLTPVSAGYAPVGGSVGGSVGSVAPAGVSFGVPSAPSFAATVPTLGGPAPGPASTSTTQPAPGPTPGRPADSVVPVTISDPGCIGGTGTGGGTASSTSGGSTGNCASPNDTPRDRAPIPAPPALALFLTMLGTGLVASAVRARGRAPAAR